MAAKEKVPGIPQPLPSPTRKLHPHTDLLGSSLPKGHLGAELGSSAVEGFHWAPPPAQHVFSSRGQLRGDAEDCWSKTRLLAARLLRSPYFDAATGFVILLNAMTIGIAQSLALQGKPTTVVESFESVFLIIYIFDLALWFVAMGIRCLSIGWVKLDCMFVCVGILDIWVLSPVFETEETFKPLMALRMLRLLRLARAVRLLYKFRPLWILVQGLATSARTMASVLLMIGIVLYLFACLGIEVITNNPLAEHDDAFRETVEESFYSLPMTMLTLLQFLYLVGCAEIYSPLVRASPSIAIYFVAIILVAHIVLMNLVTAVIVEGALETANANAEAKYMQEMERKRKLVQELQHICAFMDQDCTGVLSDHELHKAAQELPGSPHHDAYIRLLELLGATDASEVAEVLGMPCGEGVEIQTLCGDIYEMVTLPPSTPAAYVHVEKDCVRLQKRLKLAEARLVDICGLFGGRQRVLKAGVAAAGGKVDTGGEAETPIIRERAKSRRKTSVHCFSHARESAFEPGIVARSSLGSMGRDGSLISGSQAAVRASSASRASEVRASIALPGISDGKPRPSLIFDPAPRPSVIRPGRPSLVL